MKPENILGRLTFTLTKQNTQLETASGSPIVLEIIEWTNPNKDTTWIMLTAVSDKQAVGFIDIRYYPLGEIKIAKLEAPQGRVAHALGSPHQEIRNERISGNDGFFILPEYRGQKIGSELLAKSIALLKEKKADLLIVVLPKKSSASIYSKFGGVQYNGEFSNFHFKLK